MYYLLLLFTTGNGGSMPISSQVIKGFTTPEAAEAAAQEIIVSVGSIDVQYSIVKVC